MDLQKFNLALEFAAKAHERQNYASGEEMPQIVHPFFVATTLLRHGFSDEVVCTGVLHDVVEDTKYTRKDIENRFGETIAGIVEGVTFDQTLPWKDRQISANQRISKASPEVCALKCADMVHHFVLYLDRMAKGAKIYEILGHTEEETLWKYNLILSTIENKWNHLIVTEARKLYKELEETFQRPA